MAGAESVLFYQGQYRTVYKDLPLDALQKRLSTLQKEPLPVYGDPKEQEACRVGKMNALRELIAARS